MQPNGTTGGSDSAERDRRPSGDIDVGTTDGGIERDAPPPEVLAGAAGDELSQQLEADEG